MEDKFHIRPGDQLLGVRKKGFQENFFLAKVIALEEGEITCMVSLDPFKPGERMEFSSKTGELLGDADYSLLKKLNFAEAVNSRTNKPPEGRVEGYSVYVVAKWKAGENKEKVGVGYYDIHNKRWLMPGEKDGGATGVLDSSVISWIRVPEILEVMEKI